MLPIIKNQARWWKNRKINWREHYFVPHAHQKLIIDKLKLLSVGSVVEVGCAAGKNIYLIKQTFPWVEVGGTDINEDAIQTARDIFTEKNMEAALLEVCPADNLFLNDKSVDMVLTDACLIYGKKINRILREFKRVARKQVLFVELHEKSFKERFTLLWKQGLRAHDYERLLKKHGFYDIQIEKIPEEVWPGEPWSKFGFVITAKI